MPPWIGTRESSSLGLNRDIFSARLNNFSLHDSVGSVVAESLIKADSPLRKLMDPPGDRVDDALTVHPGESALIVAQLLDGTIEHLYWMRNFFGSISSDQQPGSVSPEGKAHRLGILAIMEILRISNSKNPIFWKKGGAILYRFAQSRGWRIHLGHSSRRRLFPSVLRRPPDLDDKLVGGFRKNPGEELPPSGRAVFPTLRSPPERGGVKRTEYGNAGGKLHAW